MCRLLLPMHLDLTLQLNVLHQCQGLNMVIWPIESGQHYFRVLHFFRLFNHFFFCACLEKRPAWIDMDWTWINHIHLFCQNCACWKKEKASFEVSCLKFVHWDLLFASYLLIMKMALKLSVHPHRGALTSSLTRLGCVARTTETIYLSCTKVYCHNCAICFVNKIVLHMCFETK